MRGHAVELFGVFEKSIFIEPRDVFELEEADLGQHFDELRDQLRLRLVHVNGGQFDEILLSKGKLVLNRALRHGRRLLPLDLLAYLLRRPLLWMGCFLG